MNFAKADVDKILALEFLCGKSFSDKESFVDEHKFVEEYLRTQDITNSPLKEILTELFSGAGVCDQRSKIFMLLASFYGIPVRFNVNDIHASSEYFINNAWQAIELGGRKIQLKLHKHLENNLPPDQFQFKPIDNETIVFLDYFVANPIKLNEKNGLADWLK